MWFNVLTLKSQITQKRHETAQRAFDFSSHEGNDLAKGEDWRVNEKCDESMGGQTDGNMGDGNKERVIELEDEGIENGEEEVLEDEGMKVNGKGG